jgi:hypothetical protein
VRKLPSSPLFNGGVVECKKEGKKSVIMVLVAG